MHDPAQRDGVDLMPSCVGRLIAATATGMASGPKMFIIKRDPSNGALKSAA
jgi:hypothetical protein